MSSLCSKPFILKFEVLSNWTIGSDNQYQLEEDEQLARAIQESLNVESPMVRGNGHSPFPYGNGHTHQPVPFSYSTGYRYDSFYIVENLFKFHFVST